MTLKTQMTADLPTFFDTDEFADTITYSSSSIPAIVDYLEDKDEVTGVVVARVEIEVRASDVASPAYRDTVKIGSDTWYMARVVRGDGYVWRLALERDERPVI